MTVAAVHPQRHSALASAHTGGMERDVAELRVDCGIAHQTNCRIPSSQQRKGRVRVESVLAAAPL
jgi:hypothetical protein